ncbi:MAG: NAD-dependent epimerase/dehydratase family protein, partial [Bryobacteraceae bacterium]
TRFEWLNQQNAPGASRLGIAEMFPTAGARSVYGMTKLAAELMIEEFADAYGLRYVIDRCGLIAGPWQMGKVDQGVVTLWLAAHYFGQPLRYIGFGGQGKQVRDILHIDDLAELVAMQVSGMDRFHGQTLNAGGGLDFSLSLQEMTSICEGLTGKRIELGSEPAERRADLRIYVADIRKIEEVCGWRPSRGPSAVLGDILSWVRDHQDQVCPALFAPAA